jgi:hypothetical protein
LVTDDSYQTSYVRQKAKNGEIAISSHALENMGLRKIWQDEAIEAIISGDEIEIQRFDGKNVRVIFQEPSGEVPRFAVVVDIDHPDIVMVTVFNFNEEKFEYIESQKRWRRKK